MAHWLIGNDRWYVCSVCRYTYDNKIERVSDRATCPNCHAPMESVRRVYRWSSDLVSMITRIDSTRTELHDIAVKPATTEQESDTCGEAMDLLTDFKNMLLRTKVEI